MQSAMHSRLAARRDVTYMLIWSYRLFLDVVATLQRGGTGFCKRETGTVTREQYDPVTYEQYAISNA